MIKLNIGSGAVKMGGYTNVDIRALPEVDLVCDLMEICNHFEPGSVDEIIATDVIEHFGHVDVDNLLRKLHSILRPGGVLKVQVPDVDYHVAKYSRGEYSSDNLSYWLYGAQDYPENYHKMCFNYDGLKSHLKHVGFKGRGEKIPRGINFAMEAIK